MKHKTSLLCSLAALFAVLSPLRAAEMPPMPEPQKEHTWLQKFVGRWESESEVIMEPGKPPVKSKGSESARMLGGFWIVSEGKGEMMGSPFSSVLTLGYDPEKKQYIGTWVDSMTSKLWTYTGKVNDAGTTLTLESEGPCPLQPGKTIQFKETVEFKSADHRIFTSAMKGDDGQWVTMMTINSRRVAETR